MKYLKLFEQSSNCVAIFEETYQPNEYIPKSHIPKFNVGDYVRHKNDETNTIYVIDGYDYRNGFKNKVYLKDRCRLRKYEDKNKLADREGFFSWENEDQLYPLTDEEIDLLDATEKYNL